MPNTKTDSSKSSQTPAKGDDKSASSKDSATKDSGKKNSGTSDRKSTGGEKSTTKSGK